MYSVLFVHWLTNKQGEKSTTLICDVLTSLLSSSSSHKIIKDSKLNSAGLGQYSMLHFGTAVHICLFIAYYIFQIPPWDMFKNAQCKCTKRSLPITNEFTLQIFNYKITNDTLARFFFSSFSLLISFVLELLFAVVPEKGHTFQLLWTQIYFHTLYP